MILAGGSEVYLCVLVFGRILLRSGTRDIVLNFFNFFLILLFFHIFCAPGTASPNEVWLGGCLAGPFGDSPIFVPRVPQPERGVDAGVALRGHSAIRRVFSYRFGFYLFIRPSTVFQIPYKIDLSFRFW